MLQPDINEGPSGPYEPEQAKYYPTQPGQTTPTDQLSNQAQSFNYTQPSNYAQSSNYNTQQATFQQTQPFATSGRGQSRGLRTGAIIALTVVLLLVFGVGLFAGWQFGRTSSPTSNAVGPLQSGNSIQQPTIPPPSGNNIEAIREAVVAKVKPAIVQINVSTQNGAGLGSGVIIDRRGYIVTNNHVVSGAQTIQVVMSDRTRPLDATLVGTDPNDDLAVLKINPPANMVVAALGDSSKLRIGQEVLAIGNPLGNTQTVTHGIVSALGRNVSEGNGGAVLPNTIQTDAPINPGNSGGALVDLQGNLIGIPTLAAIDPEFRTPANGVGFAIPSNRVNLIVPQIIQNGKVTHTGRAALNIQVSSVDAQIVASNNLATDHGALIAQVQSGGAADRSGLQTNDVIVQIDDQAVNDISSLGDVLANKNPGDTVSVKIYRGNQQLTIKVTLGELQAN